MFIFQKLSIEAADFVVMASLHCSVQMAGSAVQNNCKQRCSNLQRCCNYERQSEAVRSNADIAIIPMPSSVCLVDAACLRPIPDPCQMSAIKTFHTDVFYPCSCLSTLGRRSEITPQSSQDLAFA